MFCGNCGVRWPHGQPEPAATGNTVRQAAPPEPPADGVDWDEEQTVDGRAPAMVEPLVGSVRRGKGEPTQPRAVKSGVPGGPKDAAAGGVASLIADELEEPPTEPRRMVGDVVEPVEEDASEPLELEPGVDAAVAQATGVEAPAWANLTEEIAEIQFSLLQGLGAQAKRAFAPLAADHPGHPELAALARDLGVPFPSVSSKPSDAEPDVEEFDIDVDITAGRMRGPTGPVAAPDKPDITVVTQGPQPARPYADAAPKDLPPEAETSPTFVEGTAPPAGGFVQAPPAIPASVEPRTTPALGLSKASGRYPASTDSMMPTNPRVPQPRPETTVVSAKPSAPAPYQGAPPQDVGPVETVRLVMLGSRGQSLHEVMLRPGDHLDVGREPNQPWGDDEQLEPRHARFTPAPGGGVLVEPLGAHGVFRQVDERLVVRDGDEFRVGQSIVRYRAGRGWGELECLPMGEQPASSVSIGGSGALVGRENADVEIPGDTYVSGAHCQFSCRGDTLYIEDLGSANGTYTRVRATEAVPYGALLLLGQTQFKIRPVTSRRSATR